MSERFSTDCLSIAPILDMLRWEKGDGHRLPPAALRVLRTKGACHLFSSPG